MFLLLSMEKFSKAVKYVSISPKAEAVALLPEEEVLAVVKDHHEAVAHVVAANAGTVEEEVAIVTEMVEDMDHEMGQEIVALKEDTIVAKLLNPVMAEDSKVAPEDDHAGINHTCVSSGITSASTRYTSTPVPNPSTAIRKITLMTVGSISK